MSVLKSQIQNFGLLKNVFNDGLVESVVNQDATKKDTFKQYVNLVNENEILKAQFLVYTNIENKIESDYNKALFYVNENIKLFSKYSKKDILNANTKLVNIALFEQVTPYDKSELHENISKLIFTEQTPESIDVIVEATGFIVDYIINNKPREIVEAIELPNSLISSMMVDKYNEKYATLDESEKRVLKALIDSTDEEKKEVYTSTLNECLTLINEKLDTTDLVVKEKLLKVKERLLGDKQVVDEDFNKNISKLVELRSNLKEN